MLLGGVKIAKDANRIRVESREFAFDVNCEENGKTVELGG